MASALLRLSSRRGSAFRLFASSAATAAAVPSGGEGLAVRRTVSLRAVHFADFCARAFEEIGPPRLNTRSYTSCCPLFISLWICYKELPFLFTLFVQLLQKEVDEIDRQLNEELAEILKQYKQALQETESGCFERFLSYCGMPKNKYGDGFARGCELTTVFVMSGMVGFMVARVKTLNEV